MTPAIAFTALWPELLLLIGGCVVLLLGQAAPARRRLIPWTALLAQALALAIVLLRADEQAAGTGLAYGGLTYFVRLAGLEIGLVLTLINWYEARESQRGEYLALLLFSLAGLLLVGAADNLFVLFLALELVSVPTYIMIVIGRESVRALEAGTKYFYLGAMSAAVMAYGFVLLYGVAGTASLSGAVVAVSEALAAPGTLPHGLALAGLLLAIGGLLFKIAAFPLHFYIADVYQGAGSPVAGLLGFVPKLAGFVALFRIVNLTGHWTTDVDGVWTLAPAVFGLLWLLAALSMTVGNVLALRQTNIKRMLGYSGIAHAGYMLVGVLVGPVAGARLGGVGIYGDGTAAVLYYTVAYGLANLCAFAVLGLLTRQDEPAETLRDVAGLVRRSPGPALLLVLAMFTLLGMPPTPGFWGKLALFGSAMTAAGGAADIDPAQASWASWLLALVVLGVLNSAISAAYYLRVVAAVLLYENEQPARAEPREAQHVGALLCGFLLLLFSFYPNTLMTQGQMGTREIRPPAGVRAAPGLSAPTAVAAPRTTVPESRQR